MRLIDADALKKDLTRFYDNEVTAKRLIDEQPTIEQEPSSSENPNKWIPVSERLPEEAGKYLCSYDDDDIATSYFDIRMNEFNILHEQVTAWMSVPESYKPQIPTREEPQESDHKCRTCKHYTSGERDGSCGSYICKHYSGWERSDKE